MSFALFVVYLLMMFVRPAEHFVELRDVPFMQIASILALVGGALAILMGSRPPLRAGQVSLIFLIIVWMTWSVLVTGSGSEAFDKVLGFIKSPLTAFLLVILNVTTVRRVRVVALVLTIPAVFLAIRTASDYQTHLEEVARSHRGDLETEGADSTWDNPSEQTGEPVPKFAPDDNFRVMNKGLFGDPNDLALTLIAILPFTLALRRKAAPIRNVLLVWIPVAVIVYGVYVTRSRGGVLALACVLGLLVRHKLGNSMSLATAGIAVVGLLGAGFVGSRSMSMDQSAEGRIEMWSAGLQNLKGSPLWGIGFSNFDPVNSKAAHSAYVQCFAELGLVGYVLWLGLLLVTLDDLRGIHASAQPEDADLRHWSRAVQVSLIGFLIGAIFLSRAYDVQMFILIGLGTAMGDVARRRGYLKVGRSILTWIYICGGAAIGSIVGYWLYMRLHF
jgi:putative inorganic carbon (HCO3(-)) transporter